MNSNSFPPGPVADLDPLLSCARQHLAQQHPLEAARAYFAVLAKDPNCLEAHRQLGFLFFQAKEYQTSLECLRRAAALAPREPKLNLLMGAVLRELGRLDESAACCRREIQLSPLDAEAHYHLGLVLRWLDRLGEAAESFKQALKLRPGYADAMAGAEAVLRELTSRAQQSAAGKARAKSPDSGGDPVVRAAGVPDEAPLYYSGQPGNGFGWGVCNRYLLTALSKLTTVCHLDPSHPLFQSQALPGDFFTPLQGQDFTPFSTARGRHNFGYVFFEKELVAESAENARQFEIVFAGSTWCLERLHERGISNTALLIQGVDTTLFHPQATAPREHFVLFSGGKFELRKGQDLVLKAFCILSRKYPDLRLMTAWHNAWPSSMETMQASPHIRFERTGGDWVEQMEHIYGLNGIDPQRVVTLPSLPSEAMAQAIRQSDLGIFPNRCEGGTNLVLMEYLACGKPAIVTDATGHKDICHERNAFLLRSLRPFPLHDQSGKLVARWVEPSLDEIIASIEYAYGHRAEAEARGNAAGEDMKQWPWKRAAETIIAMRSKLVSGPSQPRSLSHA
jgi:tetratricopeptide (TPR) repeat protein